MNWSHLALTLTSWILLLGIQSRLAAQRFVPLNDKHPMGLAEEIYQDRYGFLWLGTVNGLIRYDGYQTISYTHDHADSTTIGGNNINAIMGDEHGRLWVGLRAFGLSILDSEYKEFKRICLPDSIGNCRTEISVNDIALDSSGTMWVGSNDGLYSFSTTASPHVTKFYAFDQEDSSSLHGDYILRMIVDSRNRLWIGTSTGINLFDRETGRFVNNRNNPGFTKDQILDIDQAPDGKIWLSPRFVPDALLIFDEDAGEFTAPANAFPRELGELRITFTEDNNIWASARGVGAYYFDLDDNEKAFYDPNLFNLHGYQNIYGLDAQSDRYGNVWFIGGKVLQMPSSNKSFQNINTHGQLVISVYGDENDILYCSDSPHRLDRRGGNQTQYLPGGIPRSIRVSPAGMRSNPDTKRVYTILPYDDENLIIATTRNMVIWNRSKNSFRDIPMNYGGPFRDFVLTPDKKQVWICGNQGVPILLDLATETSYYPDHIRSIRNPLCATYDLNNNIWFGTSTDGLFKMDLSTNEVTTFRPDHSDPTLRISDYFINDIFVGHDNTVWAGTNLGLNRIDPRTNEITVYRKGKGFPNENVESVIVDDQGLVWLGTQSGLVRFDPEAASFTHYNKSDGLVNATYSRHARWKDEEGTLYFGGDSGIDYFDPRTVGINSIPPDLYIGAILINNEPVDTARAAFHIDSLCLSHNENFIEIELLALHLTSPEANQYAYRIPQIQDRWTSMGTRRRITLANTKPGRYTVLAKASNADGVWSAEKELIRIRILPPFWQTWWFISLCTLCVAALIYAAYRYRVRQIRAKEHLKTEFNKRIAELESRALRAQMNPHFLFNSLNSVKSLISQGESYKATQYLTRFGQLIRQVLANSEQHVIRLQEELEALRLYLEIEQLRFQNFEYSIDVASDVDVDFIEVPPLILQPYVENAIWHGLMHKPNGERTVDISVIRDEHKLILTVEDNGIGRVEASKISMRGNARKGGMGMRVTGDRLKLLERLYGRSVQVDIEDLYDNHNTASGTRVTIIIPYQA